MRARFAGLCLLAAFGLSGLNARATTTAAPVAAPLNTYFAGMHNHTGYSDGVPGTTPATAYAGARANGLDIMTTTEHSEGFDVPTTLSTDCLDPAIYRCALADGTNSVRKWDANGEQAGAATVNGQFVAARGFEWTSDEEDHANVYLSSKYENAKTDGGYATMATFWKFVLDDKDALVTFNHPGDKTNKYPGGGVKVAPGPFDDFRYIPDADRRTVGIEVFNGDKRTDYTSGSVNWIARALNTGWHVGLVGAQDTHTEDWGQPNLYARTAFLMPSLTPGAFRDALLARRFYASVDPNLLVTFGTSDGDLMGSRIRKPAGAPVGLNVSASDPDGDVITKIELFSSPDPGPNIRDTWKKVGEEAGGSLSRVAYSTYGEKWYLARVTEADGQIAYTSPIWIGADTHGYGEWLAGDLHVHTQNGHDTCMSADPTKKFDGTACGSEFYTWSFTPGERIQLAKDRGLDFLAITDHQNVTSQSDPEYLAELAAEQNGTSPLTLIPAYENSLPGHAQMLGTTHCIGGQHTDTSTPIHITYCDHQNDPSSVTSYMSQIRNEGGAFQINHPGDYKWYNNYKTVLLSMVPDSVEVWNIGPWEWQQPAPSANDNDFALTFWETFLNAGEHVAATGGSDSHWRSTSGAQGVGQPTTWVYSDGSTYGDVLRGIRDGHTLVSHQPPVYGRTRIFLEADADGNGTFESMEGDTVPAGASMRYRLDGAPPGAEVRIVQGGPNGVHVEDLETASDGAPVSLSASATWVRVELLVPDAKDPRTSACNPMIGSQTTLCRNRLVVLSLGSAIYLAS